MVSYSRLVENGNYLFFHNLIHYLISVLFNIFYFILILLIYRMCSKRRVNTYMEFYFQRNVPQSFWRTPGKEYVDSEQVEIL